MCCAVALCQHVPAIFPSNQNLSPFPIILQCSCFTSLPCKLLEMPWLGVCLAKNINQSNQNCEKGKHSVKIYERDWYDSIIRRLKGNLMQFAWLDFLHFPPVRHPTWAEAPPRCDSHRCTGGRNKLHSKWRRVREAWQQLVSVGCICRICLALACTCFHTFLVENKMR